MRGFIYIIRNTINNKVYIGQTRTSVSQRWKEHLRHARYGDQVINRAMRKYGVDKFYIETLEICDLEILDLREVYYIDLYDSTNKSSGYNISVGGKTPKFKRKALSISELVHLYVDEKFTLTQLSEKYGISRYIITTELRNAGIQILDAAKAKEKWSKLKKEDLTEAIKSSVSLRKAAKYAKVPYSTFRFACKLYNIEYNSSKSARHLKL